MRVRKGLLLGVVLLLLVDVIWVGSAAITRHLFSDDSYRKPLFWTYFKTTLFTIYLTAFIFWRPWHRMCLETCVGSEKKKEREVRRERLKNGGGGGGGVGGGRERRKREVRMNNNCTQNHILSEEEEEEEEEEGEEGEGGTSCAIDETTGQCNPLDRLDSFEEEEEREWRREGEGGTEEEGGGGGAGGNKRGGGERRGGRKGVGVEAEEEEEEEDEENRGGACVRRCVLARSRNGGMSGGGGGDGVSGEGVRRNRNARVVDGRVLFHSNAFSGICPLTSDLETCKLVGPPEFKPLKCTLTEEDAERSGPLPPCSTKCCKVRFQRIIEVREVRSNSTVDSTQCSPTPPRPMPVWKVALLSVVFGLVWFFANYLYALALVSKSVALVNTLSSMSSVFVVGLAAIPVLHTAPGDKLTLSRVLVALLSVGGAVMVSVSDSLSTEHQTWSAGALIALASSFLYAVYLVLLKKLVPDPDTIELPMFFGFVGLFMTLFLLPLVLIWHYTGIEAFEWPPTSDIWTLLLVNGFIGTVLSELLWLMGVFLTSPLVGTLSLSLVTPLSITYSIVFNSASISVTFIIGALLIISCFVAVSILEYLGSWDPLWALIKTIVVAARDTSVHRGYGSLSEESQNLIQNEPSQCTDQLPSY